METSAALEGALEEILLQHRPLIEQTLYPLAEGVSLEGLVARFREAILALRGQEPAFWELRVVEYIRNVLEARVAEHVRSTICSVEATGDEYEDAVAVHSCATATAAKSEEFRQALQQTYLDVQAEVARLKMALDGESTAPTENNPLLQEATDQHFLEKFWAGLQTAIVAKEPRPEEGEEEGEMAVFDNCSFDGLTFDDDFNDASRSASSFPCMEDIPAAIHRMQSLTEADHAAGLDEVARIPIVEVLHCGPSFPVICAAIVGLFLDSSDRNGNESGSSGTAARAKRLIYDLMNQVEDPTQFLELYWAVVDFVGKHLESGELFVEREGLQKSDSVRVTTVIDCFRLLLALFTRVPRHWIYFSPEALARVLHSAFRLLVMYSTSEVEIEANHAKPLTVLALAGNQHLKWFKLWLFKAPNQAQLFAALDESGLVHDLLQYLSRVRPLVEKRSLIPAVDAAERHAIQCALSVLSFVCEYREGRELLGRWKRVSAHTQMKQRHTKWIEPDLMQLESTASENDKVYHLVTPIISEEEPRDDLEANYEHLGNGVIDALVLSIAGVIVTSSGNEPCDLEWAQQVAETMSTYIHTARVGVSIALLLEIVRTCWKDHQVKSYPTDPPDASQEREMQDPWLPFRQSKNQVDIRELFSDCVSTRIRHGKLSCTQIKVCGQLLLVAVMSNQALMEAVTKMPDPTTIGTICELSRLILDMEQVKQAPHKGVKSYQKRILEAITSMATSPRAVSMMDKFGVMEKLIELYASRETDDAISLPALSGRTLGAISHSTTGLRFIVDAGLGNININSAFDKWQVYAVADFRGISGLLALLEPSKIFFTNEAVQTAASRALDELQESANFTMALNSHGDECAAELYGPMNKLMLLRCCLSTQHASSIMLAGDKAPQSLLQFIVDILSNHNRECCSSSCAEDTCCVAFQLALALASSLPAMLNMSRLLSDLQILDLDDKSDPQCEWMSTDGGSIGSCTLLLQQLRYEFSFIGGPNEKLRRCELFEFDEYSSKKGCASKHEDATGSKDADDKRVTDFAITLQKKILQTIAISVETEMAESVDFVLLSQASWELINELETPPATAPRTTHHKSTPAFTDVLGQLMYSLVTSGRSRLEPTTKAAEFCVDTAESSLENAEAFFPSDSERKLMNRLYKSYAQRLSLEASPTAFHCIVKQFGKLAMDAFPVTVLMLLHPRYDEEEVIEFLLRCLASPLAGFLWPASAAQRSDDSPNEGGQKVTLSPSFAIAEAVEYILEREYPQVLHTVDQCHCSVLTLVLRWHDQSFWNYMDWENIVVYVYLSVLYGAELQVYCIVAILKHLEPRMREIIGQHSTQNLMPFLAVTREPIANFCFSSWRLLLLRLRSEYHDETVKTLAGAC